MDQRRRQSGVATGWSDGGPARPFASGMGGTAAAAAREEADAEKGGRDGDAGAGVVLGGTGRMSVL